MRSDDLRGDRLDLVICGASWRIPKGSLLFGMYPRALLL